ncbi:unnamed protein product [Heterobilharzia americana]|nr:unnamed protein product [Heterobilharzia americana]
MRNASCNQHPSVSQLIPHLVKSAELFLSLANTSSSSNDKLIESRHHSRTSSEVDMNTSLREEKRKKISSVSYCPVEKLRNNSKEFIFTGLTPNTDPLKSINLHDNDNRTDEFTDDEMNKGLNSNEWVVIRTVHPILLTDNYPELINYIKNASLRVSRRRQACKSWHSQYWPKTTEITNISSSSSKCTPVTDDILELQERQAQQDLYKTTSSNYLNDCSLSPSTKYHAKIIKEHEKCLKNDNEDVDDIGIGVYDSSSSSVHLHSLSLQHASSLYQLNYLNDFSDEENCHENDKEDKHVDTTTTTTTYNNFTVDTVERDDNNNLLSISTDRNLPHACSMESFHSINHSKVNSSQLSKLAPKFKNYPEKQMNKAEVTVMKKNVDHDDSVILSRIPIDLYSPSLINSSSNSHLDGNSIQVNNHNSFISIPYNVSYLNNEIVNDNINKNERREYELENFLAALDCLPSPGHCTKHFGHLSPFISYSKIDTNFLKKLDEYIKEFEQSQLDIDTLTPNITTITTSITNAKNENVSSNYDDE